MLNLLDKFEVNYDDLNPAEKETYNQWIKALSSNQLTLESVKEYLNQLISAVERELTELKETTSFWTFLYGWKKDFYLKARLKNYLMIQDFLTAQDRAVKHIEQSIKNIKKGNL
jgi:vacuolar-type H+-ATPase subunit E/Vma4